MSDYDEYGAPHVNWWEAEEGKVHQTLLPYVRTVERRQSDYFDRFLMYEAHYDPNGVAAEMGAPGYQARLRGLKENVVAICVDTVRALIAATAVRARFMTDGAGWSTQRRAELLEDYAWQIGKLTKIGDACRAAFFACAKKGTGVVRVYADQDRQIHVEPVMVDNIIVDDRECANESKPRQLHYRQADFDCDALCQQFPAFKHEIMRARGTSNSLGWRRARGADRDTRNDVLVCESWRLPMGVYGTARYVPGEHVICIEGADLFREKWHKPHFGMAEIRYFERECSWYGGGLAERIIGHQRVLDRRRHQQDRQLDYAVPTWFLDHIDANVKIQTTQAGNIVSLKGSKPTAIVPNVLGNEIMNQIMDARASAVAEIGLNDMSTRGVKQPGVESAVAIRELRDQGSERFSMQEAAYERLWLDVVELTLDVCRDLGEDAPPLMKATKFGPREVPWEDVEMTDVRVMIEAASTLSRTPAGRVQTVLELTQAGLFTKDESLRLLDHPDAEHTTSLYTASLEMVESDLEAIEEGHFVIPDPFAVNLEIAQAYAQHRFAINSCFPDVPESVLEGLRTYGVQAADFLSRAAANTNAAMTAGAAPPMPVDLPMPTGPAIPPMAMPQQVPSAGPPLIPAGTGPVAA